MKPCDVEDTPEGENNPVEALKPFCKQLSEGRQGDSNKRQLSAQDSFVNSYWKMAHVLATVNPEAYEMWMDEIEDDDINFVQFTHVLAAGKKK